MKLNKTKNTVRNVIFGGMLKIYQILVPFAFRSIIVWALGVKYLGLNSLFTSVLQVLNLAELGVGSAMVFSMYKPIVENDTYKICALMKLYRVYYRIIGLIIAVVGLACTPFIPKLINGEIPNNMNVYVLYLLNLMGTVLTYWLFSYRSSIFSAYQRLDVTSKVSIITDTVKYALQLVALIIFRNYYYFVIAILISQILYNCLVAYMSKKMYPQYNPEGDLEKSEIAEINGKIKDVFTSKVGGTIVSSADTIVISAFLGLEMLAIYQNYFYIINAVMSFIIIINNSIVAGFGNNLITDSLEKNYEDFEMFNFLQFWIMGFCVACFSALLQPFMKLWMGEGLMLPFSIVVLLCIYFWGFQLEKMLSVFKDAGGIWHEDRYRPLIYGVTNLILNVIMVQFIGIFGVVLSTIITVFGISIPWIIHNIFTLLYKRSAMEYLKNIGYYTFVSILVVIINYYVCGMIPGAEIVAFVLKCVVCVTLPNMLFFMFYRKKVMFSKSVILVKHIIKRKNVA